MCKENHQYEKLIQTDGINEDIRESRQNYLSCFSCTLKFDEGNIPCLLQCGHLISNDECAKLQKDCPICKEKLVVKREAYRGMFDIKSNQIFYSFILKDTSKNRENALKAPLEITLEKLFKKVPFMMESIENLQEKNVHVIINSGSILYMANKDKKLKQMPCIWKTPQQSSSNCIAIANRLLGGIIRQPE